MAPLVEESGVAGTYLIVPERVQLEVVLDDVTYKQFQEFVHGPLTGAKEHITRGILAKFFANVDLETIMFRAVKSGISMKPKPNVCVDLDGVVASYDRWRGLDHFGEPIPGAREFLQAIQHKARVVIFTVRCKADGPNRCDDPSLLVKKVEEWLNRHDLPYDEVYSGQGKPLASAYVDDRGISCCPQNEPSAFPSALLMIGQLLQGAK